MLISAFIMLEIFKTFNSISYSNSVYIFSCNSPQGRFLQILVCFPGFLCVEVNIGNSQSFPTLDLESLEISKVIIKETTTLRI